MSSSEQANSADPKATEPQPHADWALIQKLGGVVKVAAKLGYPRSKGPMRVENWKFRGIPAKVKVDHPDLFMRDRVMVKRKKPTATPAPAGETELA